MFPGLIQQKNRDVSGMFPAQKTGIATDKKATKNRLQQPTKSYKKTRARKQANKKTDMIK